MVGVGVVPHGMNLGPTHDALVWHVNAAAESGGARVQSDLAGQQKFVRRSHNTPLSLQLGHNQSQQVVTTRDDARARRAHGLAPDEERRRAEHALAVRGAALVRAVEPAPHPLLWSAQLEDSPSGLWRSLGKRVGCKPSGVRISHPPPLRPRVRRPAGVL